MIKFVLLDLDDTILDFHKAERIALTKTLETLGLEPRDEVLTRYSEINAAQWRLLEQGKLTREEVKERRYRLLFEEFHVDVDPIQAARTYEHNLSIGHYFLDGAEQMLQQLSRRYALYLVSNGSTAIQMPRIASAGIEKYFKKMFISEEVGYNKPSVEFFEAVFQTIPHFEKEKAVIVGDSLSSDIQGGKNAGITTVWFNLHSVKVSDCTMPDYTITQLHELPALLEQL